MRLKFKVYGLYYEHYSSPLIRGLPSLSFQLRGTAGNKGLFKRLRPIFQQVLFKKKKRVRVL